MTNKQNNRQIDTIIRRAAKFSKLDAARRWAYLQEKAWIVHGYNDGENCVFLVVRPVDAARLQKVGYEIIF